MSCVSFLEKLLDGVDVEWKALGEVARIRNGKDHKSLGDGEFPVYGSGGIMRYADTYAYRKPSVLIPRKGSLGNLFYVDVPFWTVDTIFYTEIDEAQISPKYFYYYLTTVGLGEMNQAGGVPSQTQSVLNELKIPIPCPENPKKSLEIQAEIVRILDAFTSLTAELTAELNARKQQYNYYRDLLLSFEEGEIDWKPLGELCSIGVGQAPQNDEIGEYPFVNAGTTPSGYVSAYNTEPDTVTTPSRGQGGIGYVGYQTKHFWCGPLCYRIRSTSKLISTRFLYHVMSNSMKNIVGLANMAGVPALNKKELVGFLVPIPPLAEQARIVAILDKFDTLTNSLSEGLPREIALRQKQYEHYRDMLLNFPRPEAPTPTGT